MLIGGQAVVSGQLIAGQLYEISYDGTNFEITSLPYPGYAESPTFSIATGTNGSFSTGLTVPPKYAQAFIRCVNPEYGYLTGDEVPIYFHSASGDQFGMVAWISGTSVKYQQGSNGIEVYNTSGGVQSITPSNWLGFVRCWGT